MVFLLYAVSGCRKLLKEDQLEAGTKAAQQEEMERRKRLEQQRKEFPVIAPVVPDSQLGDWPVLNLFYYPAIVQLPKNLSSVILRILFFF